LAWFSALTLLAACQARPVEPTITVPPTPSPIFTPLPVVTSSSPLLFAAHPLYLHIVSSLAAGRITAPQPTLRERVNRTVRRLEEQRVMEAPCRICY
jgi:hypothetical protein